MAQVTRRELIAGALGTVAASALPLPADSSDGYLDPSPIIQFVPYYIVKDDPDGSTWHVTSANRRFDIATKEHWQTWLNFKRAADHLLWYIPSDPAAEPYWLTRPEFFDLTAR
jgi:hypothetical protein